MRRTDVGEEERDVSPIVVAMVEVTRERLHKMLKHIGLAAVALVLASSAIAQTTTVPHRSQSSTINKQRQDQPVVPGQSTVPGTHPNKTQKILDSPSAGGGGSSR